MPVHRRRRPSAGPVVDELTKRLAEELKPTPSAPPAAFGQPLIIEDSTPQTNSLRAYVVWDRWEECPRELRQQAIFDAYEQAGRKESGEQLTLALGLTVPEAIDVGLLPWQVVPAHAQGRPFAPACREAMVALGASRLLGEERPQLRFASQEDAERAIDLLEEKVPGAKWRIIREVPEASTSTSHVASTSMFLRPES